jgi:hypothetical protein
MNSAEKPHWDADYSVSSVLRRCPVFHISKPFLSKFITASKRAAALLRHGTGSLRSRLLNYLLISSEKNIKISKYEILVLMRKARYEGGERDSEGMLVQANVSPR